jgi:hypothetical protein
MDIYCQRCDEPWEVYYVEHDMDIEDAGKGRNGMTPKEMFKAGVGCPCCDWGNKAPEKQSLRGQAMSLMSEMLGDDVDGMASMMDDFEYMGYFNEDLE